MKRNYSGLANRFGYALAYGRPLSEAIEADFLSAAASPYKVVPGDKPITVKYFKPNDTGLFAVVECDVPVATEQVVHLVLIVIVRGEEKHITLEDISGIAF